MKPYLFTYLMLIFLMMVIMMIPMNFSKMHPLMMNSLLTLYILISSMKLNYFNSNSWYSYIMFLIMIGGLMILFMYFTSLANNQMFNLNLNILMNTLTKIFLISMSTLYLINNFNLMILNNMNMEIMQMFNLNLKFNFNMYKNLMMDYLLNLNLYIIMYLFFTMICVLMICNKINMPMRQNLKK